MTAVRPLVRLFDDQDDKSVAEWLPGCVERPGFLALHNQLNEYSTALLSTISRAVMYSIIRKMKPQVVAEVGTLFAGTTEIMARALWENGSGILHTTDPFGGGRCPGIIAEWPSELQAITSYHALNSMDFFLWLEQRQIAPDLIFVDGNHDYEFALFDLQMAAKLLRPGGIVIMDNCELTGPFRASREFLAINPVWRELGTAVASYDRNVPFDVSRASVPGTSFAILQSPAYFTVGAGPESTGQVFLDMVEVDGLTFSFPSQNTTGTLHYQAVFRAYGDANRDVREEKVVDRIPLSLQGRGETMEHRFGRSLRYPDFRHPDARYALQLDLSWQGSAPLLLNAAPQPFKST
jgi:predicted O-methyltransferase YrrM